MCGSLAWAAELLWMTSFFGGGGGGGGVGGGWGGGGGSGFQGPWFGLTDVGVGGDYIREAFHCQRCRAESQGSDR